MDELQRQLSAFSQAYGQKGKAIVERIQQLMDGGMTVIQAVQQAFQEYDVADWLDANVSQAIVSTAQDALGAELAGALSSAELLKALSTPWDGSGMTLSQKLHGASREMRQSIVETVQNQIRRNSTVRKTAQALYDGYGYGHVTGTQELPRYLDELTRWVRSSRESMTPVDQLSMLKAIRKAKAQADGLVDDRVAYNHFRTSLKELLAKVESGSDKAARKALQVAVEEKSRYVAERIARTEAARARYDAFIARYDEDDSVVAYKWTLSSRHPVDDICNMYAEADLYGLGKGIFPKDAAPVNPAHPHCLCHYAPVYSSELKGLKRSDDVEDRGNTWLKKKPLRIQEKILGVKGREAWKAGKAGWLEKARNLSLFDGNQGSRLKGIVERTRKTRNVGSRVDWDIINSARYKGFFNEFTQEPVVNAKIYEKALKMLEHHDGDDYEDLYLINALSGVVEGASTHADRPWETKYTKEILDALRREPQNYISIHNHSNSLPPTGSDIASAFRYKFGMVFCHNGTIYMYASSKKQVSVKLFDMIVEKYEKEGYNKIEAGELALNQVAKDYGIKWRKWEP